MKNIFVVLTAILTINNASAAQIINDAWERFGDWEVKAVHDEMDPYTNIIIRTKFKEIINPNIPLAFQATKDLVFGFNLYNGSFMSVYTMVNFGGNNYWPHCDFNSASFRVDGSKPQYISTVDNPGGCYRVSMNGKTVNMFKSGKNAKLKINYKNGEISLAGFSSAYTRALHLSRR